MISPKFSPHEVVMVPKKSANGKTKWHEAVIKVLRPPYVKVIILTLKSKPTAEYKIEDIRKFNGEVR